MKPDIEALLEIVDGATPGPWAFEEELCSVATPDGRAIVLMDNRDQPQRAMITARLIATFNPALLHDLLTRMQRYEAALGFYADPETYFAIGFFPDPPCGEFMDDFEETKDLGAKPGKRARAALDEPEAS